MLTEKDNPTLIGTARKATQRRNPYFFSAVPHNPTHPTSCQSGVNVAVKRMGIRAQSKSSNPGYKKNISSWPLSSYSSWSVILKAVHSWRPPVITYDQFLCTSSKNLKYSLCFFIRKLKFRARVPCTETDPYDEPWQEQTALLLFEFGTDISDFWCMLNDNHFVHLASTDIHSTHAWILWRFHFCYLAILNKLTSEKQPSYKLCSSEAVSAR